MGGQIANISNATPERDSSAFRPFSVLTPGTVTSLANASPFDLDDGEGEEAPVRESSEFRPILAPANANLDSSRESTVIGSPVPLVVVEPEVGTTEGGDV